MRRFDQMNVIPLVDVMLVLLAIVLTTASFVAQGKIPLTLPEARHAESVGDGSEAAQEIAITADGTVYLDGEPHSPEALDVALAGVPAPTPVQLKVDRAATFQQFVIVLDLLRKHERENLSINAEIPAK
ncbi:MAG: biopolymer transporter ExbD [Halothiobacillaceae bacterium]